MPPEDAKSAHDLINGQESILDLILPVLSGHPVKLH